MDDGVEITDVDEDGVPQPQIQQQQHHHQTLQNQDLSFIQQIAGGILSQYGWYLLLLTVAVYLLVQYLSKRRASNRNSVPDTAQDPVFVVRRQEAVEAARKKMQDELDAKAALFREKQLQLEEEKRRQKIEQWESMQEGKSYKAKSAHNTEEESSSSTVLKPKTEKKSLRSTGYNPLSGDGGGASCAWRPGRRGPSAGG